MDPREKMAEIVAECGSARAAAYRLGLSHEAVAGVAAGRVNAGPRVLRALGLPVTSLWERRKAELKARVYGAVRHLVIEYSRPAVCYQVALAADCYDGTADRYLRELEAEGKVVKVGKRWSLPDEDTRAPA